MSSKQKARIVFGWLLLACESLFVHPVCASSVQNVSFSDVANVSELIIEAEVIASDSRWNKARTRIHTYIDFRIIDVIKDSSGAYSQVPNISLRFLGGSIGEDALLVDGLVYPAIGERGIYFVESVSRPQVNPLLGWSQGHYLLDDSQRVLNNRAQAISIDETTQSTQLKLGQRMSSGSGMAVGLKPASSVSNADKPLTKADFKRHIDLVLKP